VDICVGETTMLDATAGGGAEPYTYLWTAVPVDASLTGQETTQNPVVSPTVTTVYTCVVTDNDATEVQDDVTVTILTAAEITLLNWPETLCNQLEPPVQLEATPEGGTYSGNVTEDGIFTPETAPLGWNVITYTYVDENTCESSATDSIYVDNCVGINSTNLDDFIKIFPNPNSGKFKVLSAVQLKNVQIINQQGKLVVSQKANNKSINIDANLQKGVYILRITLNDNSIINRNIIIK